jgi:hypothetical protein
VGAPFLGLVEGGSFFNLGEATADSAGLLGAEVERQVLLALIEESELCSLLRLQDGQGASDVLSVIVAIRRRARLAITMFNVHGWKVADHGPSLGTSPG